MTSILAYLDSIAPLSIELRQELVRVIKPKQVQKKALLLKAGQVSRHLYFIEKGLLRLFTLKGETEVTTRFLKEGDVAISMASFFEQTPSHQFIQALEDTSLYYMTFEELQTLYIRFPELNRFGRILAERYYAFWNEQFQATKTKTAAERYAWFVEHHADIVLRVPAKYIASYLDITEVTLSKVRSRK